MAFIDYSVERHWLNDLEWLPGTDDAVKLTLHRAYNRGLSVWIINGDPKTGANAFDLRTHRWAQLQNGKVGITNPDSVIKGEPMGAARCKVGLLPVDARTIVAITDRPSRVYLYKHPNLHLGIVTLQEMVTLEQGYGEGRWQVLIDGKVARNFTRCDAALAWVKEYGLALHSLEDLYGGE